MDVSGGIGIGEGGSGDGNVVNPVDRRIKEIADGGPIHDDDAKVIRDHIAQAPFYTKNMRIDRTIRGREYLGQTIQNREPSDFAHLLKRVLMDREWAVGTTVPEYLEDLHRLVRDQNSRIAVYDIGEGPVATVFGRNNVPIERRGPAPQDILVVIYAARTASIITGYQVETINDVKIPRNARWLP